MSVSANVQPVIGWIVITKNAASRHHVLFHESVQGWLGGIRSNACDDTPGLARNDANNRSLGFLNHVYALGATAHIHFIDFNRRSLQLQIFSKQGTNLPEHAPSGFVGDTSFALDLLC